MERRFALGSWARTSAVAAVGALLLSGLGGEGPPLSAAPSSEPLVTVGVSPYRVLDTRNGIGRGGAAAPVGPGQSIDVQIAGVGPVPANAAGVVLNLTATGGTEPSYVTAWPTGEDRPTASVLNVTPGVDLPNMVTAALGDGKISLYNFTGSVHVIADIAAYLIPGVGGSQGPAGPQGPAGTSADLTQRLVITGLEVVGLPGPNPTTYGWSYGCATVGSFSSAAVSLSVPNGSLITAVQVRYNDGNDSGDLSAIMVRGISATSEIPQGTSASNSYPGTGVGTLDLPIGSPPPVADDAFYYLYFNANGAGQQVCSVVVDYTLPSG